MKYTNIHNIPQHIVEAIINDPYDSNFDRRFISTTTLINSPRVRQLYLRHNTPEAIKYYNKLLDVNKNEIEIDVSERLHSIMGSSGHSVLERIDTKDRIIEERFKERFPICADCGGNSKFVNGDYICETCSSKNGITILTGKLDEYDKKEETISDNKFTSVWSVIFSKSEWEEQLNIYAFLLGRWLVPVKNLRICAFLRDWQRNGKFTNNKYGNCDYPLIPFKEVDIKLWDYETQRNFIFEKIKLHNKYNNVPDSQLPLCTEKERWTTENTFAVMKDGNKRATKVCESKLEAEAYICQQKDKDKMSVVERKGTDRKCADGYCSVRTVCDYWIKNYKNKIEETENE